MIKAVNIVNVFNSVNMDRIFKIDSNSVIAVTTSLKFMCITHIHR
jgi:hypothetical protein